MTWKVAVANSLVILWRVVTYAAVPLTCIIAGTHLLDDSFSLVAVLKFIGFAILMFFLLGISLLIVLLLVGWVRDHTTL